jgi:hypothetical protein
MNLPQVIHEVDNPTVEHTVKAICKICDDPPYEGHGWIFNKTTSILHVQDEINHERTRCGKQATESQWLWQL